MMTPVCEFPPIESFKTWVSFVSRKGTCEPGPAVISADITYSVVIKLI